MRIGMAHTIRRNRLNVAILASFVAGIPVAARANITISDAATNNITCSNDVCVPTAEKAVLNVADLEALLAGGNIEITTTGSGVQAGTIALDAPLNWSSGSTLVLDAHQSVLIDNLVNVSGAGAFRSRRMMEVAMAHCSLDRGVA